MVKGLDTFAAFFAGDEARYVLIGGVATQLVLEEAGLPVRATRDLDIHRSDVLRLSQLLSPDDRVEVAEAIRADVARFCRQVAPDVSPQLLGQLEIAESRDALIERMRRYFGVQA